MALAVAGASGAAADEACPERSRSEAHTPLDLASFEAVGAVSLRAASADASRGTLELSSAEGAAAAAALEEALGFLAGSFDRLANSLVVRGSAVSGRIRLAPGERIGIRWRLVTNEAEATDFDDFAFVALGGAPGVLERAGSAAVGSLTDEDAARGTPWRFSLLAPEPAPEGSLHLRLGVVDVADDGTETRLLVEEVVVVARCAKRPATPPPLH